MTNPNFDRPISRRTALALGGGTAAGLLLPGGGTALAASRKAGLMKQSGKLPLKAMEGILKAEGEDEGSPRP